MDYELVRITSETDWRDYHALRREVLWRAKGRSGYDDCHPDEYLPANHPLLLKFERRSIGTTRLDDFGDGTGAIRLVTIATDLQRRGHGRMLSRLVEDFARRLGLRILHVNSAPDATGYYEKMGWRHGIWNAAELVGLAADCQQMTKVILPAG